jgi:hypothetical protein
VCVEIRARLGVTAVRPQALQGGVGDPAVFDALCCGGDQVV